jgi:hypothetical protein
MERADTDFLYFRDGQEVLQRCGCFGDVIGASREKQSFDFLYPPFGRVQTDEIRQSACYKASNFISVAPLWVEYASQLVDYFARIRGISGLQRKPQLYLPSVLAFPQYSEGAEDNHISVECVVSPLYLASQIGNAGNGGCGDERCHVPQTRKFIAFFHSNGTKSFE